MADWLAGHPVSGGGGDPGGAQAMAKSMVPGGEARPTGPSVSFLGGAAADETALWQALKFGGAIGPAFAESPLSGCTTLLDIARRSVGYSPESGGADDGGAGFERYAQAIVACPLFEAIDVNFAEKNQRHPRYLGDFRPQGMMFPAFRAAFVQTLRPSPFAEALADRATGNFERVITQKASVHDVMFYQAASPGAGAIDVALVRHAVNLAPTPTIGFPFMLVISVGGTVQFQHFRLRFHSEAWPPYADAVLARHFCDVRDWLAGN